MATNVVMPTIVVKWDSGLAKLKVTLPVFKDLGCKLLLAVNTLATNGISVYPSLASPYLIIKACGELPIPITVHAKQRVKLVVERSTMHVVIPPNSWTVVRVRFSAKLDPSQDYELEPRNHPIYSTSASMNLHGVLQSDRKGIMLTNFNNLPVTVFNGMKLGWMSNIADANAYGVWEEGSADVAAFFSYGLIANGCSFAFAAGSVCSGASPLTPTQNVSDKVFAMSRLSPRHSSMKSMSRLHNVFGTGRSPSSRPGPVPARGWGVEPQTPSGTGTAKRGAPRTGYPHVAPLPRLHATAV